MSFPQFYLHYNTRDDKTLKVDRDPKAEGPFVIAIAIEETLSKKLLAGEINETNLIVNKYADPAYVIDKALFPTDSKFVVLFDLDSLAITKISAKAPSSESLAENRQGSAPIDNRAAFSILAGDTSFNDWKIATNDDGETVVIYEPLDGAVGSSLFKNRVDFLSLAEISTITPKKAEKSSPKMCDISFDYIGNSVSIVCADLTEDHFKDFFLAITNKNDPSYLIKTVSFAPGKQVKLEFSGKKLEDMSFFTSRFHLRNTQIEVVNHFTGGIKVSFKGGKVIVDNDLTFNANLSSVTIIFRNKYDHTQVFRSLRIADNSTIELSSRKIPVDDIEIDALRISKKFITISR